MNNYCPCSWPQSTSACLCLEIFASRLQVCGYYVEQTSVGPFLPTDGQPDFRSLRSSTTASLGIFNSPSSKSVLSFRSPWRIRFSLSRGSP